MRISKYWLFVFVLFGSTLLAAQPETEAAKEKRERLGQIVEQVLAEIPNLKLPENRALFYAQAGDRLWAVDARRARQLFQTAASELIAAQEYAETKLRKINPYNELLNGGSTRQQILNTIANRDAELALELMVKTRPAAIQRALAGPEGANKKISNYGQNGIYLAQNERQMEQNFYRMAADQNPDRALQILKESLNRGIVNDTFNQLTRLAEKDPAIAAEMASQVMDKLIASKFTSDGQVLYGHVTAAQGLLNYYTGQQLKGEGRLKLDPNQVRELASKIVAAYLNDRNIGGYLGSIQKIAEQFVPGSVETIKRLNAIVNPNSPTSEQETLFRKLMEGDTSPEQIMSVADKMPENYRRQLYETASQRYAGRGNSEAARAVISENFSDEAREQMLSSFDIQQSYRLVNDGKFAEAEQVIDNLPEQQRIGALVNLANSIYGRDQKANQSYAMTILQKARSLIGNRPENAQEMSSLMQVIGGIGNIDPNEALNQYEALIPQINELVEAAAVLHGFQINSNIREGEFIATQGTPFDSFGANPYSIPSFARGDLERTIKLIDSFSRPEIRIPLKLQVAAANEPGGSGGGIGPGRGIGTSRGVGRGQFIVFNEK